MLSGPPEREGVILGGQAWVRVAEHPRLIAESFRILLNEHGIPSVLRTPFQWVGFNPVIEIETGGYMGSVALYVPLAAQTDALALLEGDGGDAPLAEEIFGPDTGLDGDPG